MRDATPFVPGLKPFQAKSNYIRHCKIIGTIGPASSKPDVLRELFDCGLNIVRLNFSHGDHATHQRNIQEIRRIAKENGHAITILQDLQGPKIRCGKLLTEEFPLVAGQKYQLVYGHKQTDPKIIPIDHAELVGDVQVGQQVMMDDGLLILRVTDIDSKAVSVEVEEGGILKSRKGVNFPDCKLSIPAMTQKDNQDLMFGLSNDVDIIALSFVQTPQDIRDCRAIIEALGKDTPIIAKIEKMSAMEQIDEIAAEADGLMVARGDLGVECRVDRVPSFQRQIISAAEKHAKPVIIATQMLESMITSPQASVAEIADVANGVLEGADCVMLSGEVASGAHPVGAVQKMASIIREVEMWPKRATTRLDPSKNIEEWQQHEAIARAAGEAADSLGAKMIVCLTLTGSIARHVVRWRPQTPVLAISPRSDVIARLGLNWGVYGMQNPLFYNTDVLLQELPKLLRSLSLVESGDIVVITAGIPIQQMSSTNTIKIEKIQ